MSEGLLLGKVVNITATSDLFGDQKLVQHYLQRDMPLDILFDLDSRLVRIAEATVLALRQGTSFDVPHSPPKPGDEVEVADWKLVREYLGLAPESRGLYVGILNGKMKITLNVNRVLNHHVAVIGSTGAGKSYLVGVLCEELAELGVPVVIIDPHGEYSAMAEGSTEPDSILREFDVERQSYDVVKFTPDMLPMRMEDADPEILTELMELTDAQADLFHMVWQEAGRVKNLDELRWRIETSEITRRFTKSTVNALLRRLQMLDKLSLFRRGGPLSELVKPRIISQIDLSGDYDDRFRRAVCALLLSVLFKARVGASVRPFVVVIEETHRFCPQDEDVSSKAVIRRLVREGRKFGISVILTTQRVIGLDKDVLSQCGTKILFRIDSKTDLDYIAPFLPIGSGEYEMIPRLTTGQAIIAGTAVNTSVVCRIRARKSRHGGVSTDYLRTAIAETVK